MALQFSLGERKEHISLSLRELALAEVYFNSCLRKRVKFTLYILFYIFIMDVGGVLTIPLRMLVGS